MYYMAREKAGRLFVHRVIHGEQRGLRFTVYYMTGVTFWWGSTPNIHELVTRI